MDGMIGVHADGTAVGCSRDNVVALANQLKGRYAVIVNDPQLCAQLLSLGVIPIYRINRQGWEDDDANHHFDAVAYVNQADHELATWEAAYGITGRKCGIYLGNELGSTAPVQLSNWMLQGAERIAALGRTGSLYNWSVQNPDKKIWPAQAQVLNAARQLGLFIGFHEGVTWQYPTVEEAIKAGAIGGYRDIMKEYGIRPFITEFAASLSPHAGWKAWMNEAQYVALTKRAGELVYVPDNAPVTPFTACEWLSTPERDTHFDYINDPGVRIGFALINQSLKVSEMTQQTVQPPQVPGVLSKLTTIPSKFVNVRQQPRENGIDLGDLVKGDIVTLYAPVPATGWVWVVTPGLQGWVSLQNGKVVFTPVTGERTVVFTPEDYDTIKRNLTEAMERLEKGVVTLPGTGGGF